MSLALGMVLYAGVASPKDMEEISDTNTTNGNSEQALDQETDLKEAKRLAARVVELYGRGKYEEALPIAARALTIEEKALGPEHPDVATSLRNLAGLYHAMGDYARAEPLYERALTIREKALGPEHPVVAASLRTLAQLYFAMGDCARAEPLYERALTIQEKALGPEHPDVAASLNDLAVLYCAMGDVSQALLAEGRALSIEERNLTHVIASGSEAQKRAYVANFLGSSYGGVSLHLRSAPQDVQAAQLALGTVVQRKGLALEAMSESIRVLRSRLNEEDRALFDELKSVRAQLSALFLRSSEEQPTAQLWTRTDDLERRADELEKALSSRSKEFRTQSQEVTLEKVQAALPADAALIELTAYAPVDAKSGDWGEVRYAAYVLFHTGEPRWAELGEAAVIDQEAASLLRALGVLERKGDVQGPARALDERIMRPVRQLLGDVRKLLLSPDGVLNLIPFGALIDEAGHYLVEHYTFTYLTSGRDLLRLQAPHDGGSHRSLVVADPDFDRRPEPMGVTEAGPAREAQRSRDFANRYFEPLPGTRAEADALRRILPEVQVLTGQEAREEVLKEMHGCWILHVATHGFFLQDQPHGPLASRGVRLDGDPAHISGPWQENPLLRSGLALAGANAKPTQGEDGILTALEASGLDLWGTKLVVLSACETGVGEVQTGEGVYGLRRALTLAGAESDELVECGRRGNAGPHGGLLQTSACRGRAVGGPAAGATGDAWRRAVATSLLLGELHPDRGLAEFGQRWAWVEERRLIVAIAPSTTTSRHTHTGPKVKLGRG